MSFHNIIRTFCRAIRKHLQQMFMQIPSVPQLRILASRFEQLFHIPYIIGAIDRSHISILASVIGPKYYYCKRSFHLANMQGIVGPNFRLWDYDFEWARSLHDWVVLLGYKNWKGCITWEERQLKLYSVCSQNVYRKHIWNNKG